MSSEDSLSHCATVAPAGLTHFKIPLTWNHHPRFTIATTPTARSKRSTLQEWEAGLPSRLQDYCRTGLGRARLGPVGSRWFALSKRLVHDHQMNRDEQMHYLPQSETSERVHSHFSIVCTAAATCSSTMVKYSRFLNLLWCWSIGH